MQAGHTTPFRLLGGSTVHAVRDAVEQAVSHWAVQWGIAPALIETSAYRAWELSGRTLDWRERAYSGALQAWIAYGAGLETRLQRLLFAPEAVHPTLGAGSSSLAEAGVAQAIDALLDAVSGAALPSGHAVSREPAATIEAQSWVPGSGCLVVSVSIDREACHILLGSSAVQLFQPPFADLPRLREVDIGDCVSDVPVSLRLDAGRAHVALDALLALSAGDVLRLDTPTDAPFALGSESESRIFDVFLGRCDGNIAVEIAHCQTQWEKSDE